jgi:hypothetical protein
MNPIKFRPTSEAQHHEITAYAQVKGFKNASAFALYACITMMSKNPLTPTQKAKAESMVDEWGIRALALAQRGKAATEKGRE